MKTLEVREIIWKCYESLNLDWLDGNQVFLIKLAKLHFPSFYAHPLNAVPATQDST